MQNSTAASQPMIRIDSVTHEYSSLAGGTVRALDEVSLDIQRGSFVTVVGPSGCGKTTLLRMLAGYLHPTSGEILVDGEPVTGPSTHRGVVFQQPTLYPWWSVQRNVEAGPRFAGVSRAEAAQRARTYLAMVGLEDFAASRTWELSGGMKQRCQIARVLANDPPIVLMDEPFGALDSLTRRTLQSDLLALHQSRQDTVFFITHSVDEAAYLGDAVVVMSPRPGRIVHAEKLPAYSGREGETFDAVRSDAEFIDATSRITHILESGR